ncbi:MAG: DUF4249 domain-containing protein [Sphingobacteriales bacterium]|nr:MAG: DUF4249 domain-containing protein [Sphingobacteriales bacterium]
MKKYFALLLLPFMMACEKKINVKLPDYEERLFFFSDVETNSNFTAFVRRSEKIKSYNNLHDLSVKNAVIQLYINDDDVRTLFYADSLERYALSQLVKPNDRIKVIVTAPGYPEASAEAVVPSEVPIESLVFNRAVRIDNQGNLISDIRIKFTDPPTAGDYYMIDIYTPYAMFFPQDTTIPQQQYPSNWICIKSKDASIDDVTSGDPLNTGDENNCLPSEGLLINDVLFNGQTKELVLSAEDYYFEPYVDSASGISSYPQIKLKHITQEYYKYLKTTRNVYDNSGNPFAEPVNVISNVKNGYGVLAPMSVSVKDIKNP